MPPKMPAWAWTAGIIPGKMAYGRLVTPRAPRTACLAPRCSRFPGALLPHGFKRCPGRTFGQTESPIAAEKKCIAGQDVAAGLVRSTESTIAYIFGRRALELDIVTSETRGREASGRRLGCCMRCNNTKRKSLDAQDGNFSAGSIPPCG